MVVDEGGEAHTINLCQQCHNEKLAQQDNGEGKQRRKAHRGRIWNVMGNEQFIRGIFKDVRFYHILAILGPLVFSMFLPHNEFWPFLGLPSPLTFHKVNNDGQSILLGAGGETTEKKDKREQNTAYARLGV